jgi:hypothetical protein
MLEIGTEKNLSNITRKEWILYQWVETTEFGHDRSFIAAGHNTPKEAADASEEWDLLQSVKDEPEEGETEG